MSSSRSHWPISLLGSAVSLLNLFLPLVLVRILTPFEIGQYKIYFLYLAMIPSLCMTAGIVNGLSHWAGHEDQRQKAFQVSWGLLLSIAFFFISLGLLLHPSLQRALQWTPLQTKLFLIGAFLSMLATFFDDASIAMGAIWRGALFNSGFDLMRNLMMLSFAVYFRRIEMVFIAHILVVLTKVTAGSMWGLRLGFQRPSLNQNTLKMVLKYSIPVSVAAGLSIITSYSDQLLVSSLIPPQEFAVYSLGCLLIPPLLIFEQSVNRVLIPRMSKAFSSDKPEAAMHLFQDAVSELSWILVPAGIGLILFAEPIVVLLFTETYRDSAKYLQIYTINQFIHVLPYDAVARARGQGTWILKQLAVFSVVTLVAVLSLTHLIGAKGALIGALSAAAAMRVHSIWAIHNQEGWPLSKMLPLKDLAVYLCFCALAVVVCVPLKEHYGKTLQWFLVGGLSFSLIYFAGTFRVFKRRLQRLKFFSI